jgi:hypothetical protein
VEILAVQRPLLHSCSRCVSHSPHRVPTILLPTSFAPLHTAAPTFILTNSPHAVRPLPTLQIDINPWSEPGRGFIDASLRALCEAARPAMLRIDAFGYATKRPGTSCFFLVRGGVGMSRLGDRRGATSCVR